MKKNKNIVFTDADLDGAGSYLLFKLATNKNIPYKTTTVTKFNDDYRAWMKKNDPDTYDNIYILDLDVSQSSLELVDKKNITIIDHHQTHVDNRDKYKQAKTYITIYPSCVKLIFKLFKKNLNISDDQKRLVALVDDYDSWNHKFPQSKQLNSIFWNYQGDRLEKFLKDFQYGFKGFTSEQLKIINFYENKFKKVISSLTFHEATTSIQKNDVKCISTFADTMISDVGNYMIEELGADLSFVINLNSNRVSIRKKSSCSVEAGKLAKMLIDGGGHDCAAGGVCTEKFLQFSKLFKPCSI